MLTFQELLELWEQHRKEVGGPKYGGGGEESEIDELTDLYG